MIYKIFEAKKPTILVVDDSPFMRVTFRSFLENEDYAVIEAENGMDAIDLFEKIRPDIVLMDYIMPGISGADTCSILNKIPENKNTPIIMVTSLEDEDSVNKAFEAGAADYISKPINWAVLRQRLNRLIRTRNAEKTLKQSEAFSRSIIDHAVEGILTVDNDGVIKYINPAAEHIFRYMSKDILGENINKIFPDIISTDMKRINTKKEVTGYRADYSTVPIEITISEFCVEEESYFTMIMRDITERKRYEEAIKYQAYYDSLTGLPNRRLLKDRVENEISKNIHSDKKFAIMFLDLDKFKVINDTLGHDVGDKLLKEVAFKLKDCVGKNDTIARIGGDEFIILLTGLIREEYAGQIANKILNIIRQPIMIDNHELNLTISIGIAICPKDGLDYITLFKDADSAMYRAKEEGKNKYHFYSPVLEEKILNN